ncbi:hypothetical protein COCMIDRAFT_23333 [Bipolaris oryzae ATCC 44560]|uniref:Heterokaryon incompatibility domain-containing protein n=1 Tax=Bipolaris oryzae ATCC 44560 TaxID=930090 RepID=W6ZGG2_COCMI|nr:uncharacterized protein COCMIDRAFT_23333 [Bipolaris oryzae ATCC 44560]EUC48963.1 hypothetical protein COCMIDRAFT_23333 [Bipolaris oryzae ATCC 44560]
MIKITATAHAWRPTLDDVTSQIRLLYLPRQMPGLDDLTVNLEVFSIKDAPKFQALCCTWRSPFSTGDEFRAWLTWCLNITGDHNSDPSAVDAYEEMLGNLDALRRAPVNKAAFQTLTSAGDLDQANVSQINNTLVGRYKRMIGLGKRTFFRTTNYYFGIAICVSRPADEVWILEDATTSFFLRPLPMRGEYTIFGEVYFHGIMNCEIARGSVNLDWKPIWLK